MTAGLATEGDWRCSVLELPLVPTLYKTEPRRSSLVEREAFGFAFAAVLGLIEDLAPTRRGLLLAASGGFAVAPPRIYLFQPGFAAATVLFF
jgi:hypothetical protein